MFDKQLTFVNKTFKDKADAINFLIHEAAAAGKLNGGEAYRKSVLQKRNFPQQSVMKLQYRMGQVMMLQNPLWLYLQ